MLKDKIFPRLSELRVLLKVVIIFFLTLPVFADPVNLPPPQNSGAEIIQQPAERPKTNADGLDAGDKDDCQRSEDTIVVDPRGNLNTSYHCKQ
jgi:hypothetical protein